MKRVVRVLSPLLFFLLIYILRPSGGVDVIASETEFQDRLIVRFKSYAPGFLKNKAVAGRGLKLDEQLLLPDTYVIKIPKGKGAEYALNLKKDLMIEYAEEDFPVEKSEIPNDPDYPKQWGLEKIQAGYAWDISHGNSDVDIAILDTGINYKHPDVGTRISKSVNCTQTACPGNLTEDPDGHGTHVAGIANAITGNSQGIAGLSWNGRLLSVKVLDDNGSGYYSWITNGIIWAADNGAEVINLSLGGSYYSLTLENAVNYAWNKGVVVVAAAGNRGSSSATYPAYFRNAIAVAASTQDDQKASFSNYGSWVDVAAPGVSVYSSYHSGYEYISGTSMSTPFVSGLAALIKGQIPALGNTGVRQNLESSADKINGTGSLWAYGRINACRALGGCSQPVPTFTPVPTLTLNPTIIPSPTPIPTFTQTPIPTPTPTSNTFPRYCKYIPWHYTCR